MPTAPHTRIRIVQSRHNARVKELRAALARPSSALVGLEGLHLVEEALRSGMDVQTIFVRAGAERLLDGLADTLGAGVMERVPEILSLPEEVLRAAVTTETPQAIAALMVPPVFTVEQLFPAAPRTGAHMSLRAPLWLVLAGVQDPGNVGTIVRSAEAFGADGVLALPGTASVWNAKSLRASMGSSFRLPVLLLTMDDALATLQAHGVLSLAAVAPGHARAVAVTAVDLRRAIALWIGNEGAGLAPEVMAACDGTVSIPCPGPVESLNAAVAASVLLYEASRQRQEPAREQPGSSRLRQGSSRLRQQKAHPNPA